MKVIKENSEFGLKVSLCEEDMFLTISFCGNLDLYWSLHSKDTSKDNTFVITKENFGIYKLFLELYDDIENINIFDYEYTDFDFSIEDAKNMYRDNNKSNYNELFNKEDKTITWYSDETAHEVANILKIKKEDERFIIKFYVQKDIKGYSHDFKSLHYIPIRFRNSGSSYDPFNCLFMKMYNKMNEIDDVNDIGHQIHFEEYVYRKKLVNR